MNEYSASSLILFIILLPAAFAVLSLLMPAKIKGGKETLLLLGFAGNLILNLLANGKQLVFIRPWSGWDIDFSLKLYHFSGFILISAAVLSFLTAVYTTAFAKNKPYTKLFYACMLFTIAFFNGAVLAGNLMVMLFFWEAILATMFVLIMVGGKNAYKTSVKAMVISGLTDLCLMLGIGLVDYLAHTLDMDQIHLPLSSWGFAAFLLMVAGAVSKAGSMPFHTWIPDAADDAPTPLLAFLPGSLGKLLGIYLLLRVCLDLFEVVPASPVSYVLMTLGAATILFAVMMALVQQNIKRLLSYCAVSQVGYMILGIGTALPAGSIGGMYHMLSQAVCMCCLFMTAGSVEQQTGTTDLNKLGGLGRKMPMTMICFLIAAASVTGLPMTSGFFSMELILSSAFESNTVFFVVAVVGALFTAITFLKLGHAVFFGKSNTEAEKVKEAPWPMLIPMLVLAASCLVLGFGKSAMINHICQSMLGQAMETGKQFGEQINWRLAGVSVLVLILAASDHYRGLKKTGKGITAADHFRNAPGLRIVYGWAEKKYFDPYELAQKPMRGYAVLALQINDGISWFYDVLVVRFIGFLSSLLKRAHNGSQSRYVIWVLAGVLITVMIFLLS